MAAARHGRIRRLYQQQQESFRNLVMVLLAAILLVFTVLVIEFRSFNEPVAIVFGAILAMFGTVAALWITGVTLNIVFIFGRDHRRRHRRQKTAFSCSTSCSNWRRTAWIWWRHWCVPATAVCGRC